MVTVTVTKAAPHHLVADGPVLRVRRTRSGDAWEARRAEPERGRCDARDADRGCARAAPGRARLPLRPT